jgi:hypothetical protein
MSHPFKLSDIREVTIEELLPRKLEALRNGSAPDGPIFLKTSSGKPYEILDGRHRIYLAREQGKLLIAADFC